LRGSALQGIDAETHGTSYFDVTAIAGARGPWFQLIKKARDLARPGHIETLRTIPKSIRDAMPLFAR
jgi:hypothetical protein